MSSRSVQLNSTTVLLFISTYGFFVFVLFLGSGMRNSFQMRCLSSVLTALFVSISIYLPEHSLWIKHRACVGIIESARMILTNESVHLLWVLKASLVWFYATGLWSAVIGKAVQSHLQRTVVDRWKVLTDEREQKYEGAWISSSRFLHVWNYVWSPPECGCRSV